MDIGKKVESSMAKVFGVFVFIFMAIAIITAIGHIGPFLSTSPTSTETFETNHETGWLSDAIGTESLIELANGFVAIDDGSTHGEAVTEWNTSELLDFVDIEGSGNETTPGYAYVSFNEFSENATAVSVMVENPDQGDSVTYDFNVTELRNHVAENGNERYYIPFWAEDVAFMENDIDGTFEMNIQLDRSNSNGTSEGSIELGEWGVGFEKTTESGTSYPGQGLLTTIGGLVLVFGGLIGLVVVLAQTLTAN